MSISDLKSITHHTHHRQQDHCSEQSTVIEHTHTNTHKNTTFTSHKRVKFSNAASKNACLVSLFTCCADFFTHAHSTIPLKTVQWREKKLLPSFEKHKKNGARFLNPSQPRIHASEGENVTHTHTHTCTHTHTHTARRKTNVREGRRGRGVEILRRKDKQHTHKKKNSLSNLLATKTKAAQGSWTPRPPPPAAGQPWLWTSADSGSRSRRSDREDTSGLESGPAG